MDIKVPLTQNKNSENQNKVISSSNGNMSEVEKLREENNRLKRTIQ